MLPIDSHCCGWCSPGNTHHLSCFDRQESGCGQGQCCSTQPPVGGVPCLGCGDCVGTRGLSMIIFENRKEVYGRLGKSRWAGHDTVGGRRLSPRPGSLGDIQIRSGGTHHAPSDTEWSVVKYMPNAARSVEALRQQAAGGTGVITSDKCPTHILVHITPECWFQLHHVCITAIFVPTSLTASVAAKQQQCRTDWCGTCCSKSCSWTSQWC
jgi:hypothetical protein